METPLELLVIITCMYLLVVLLSFIGRFGLTAVVVEALELVVFVVDVVFPVAVEEVDIVAVDGAAI